MSSGVRLSIWVPEKSTWIVDAVNYVIADADTKGIPISKSTIIVGILEASLIKYKDMFEREDDA